MSKSAYPSVSVVMSVYGMIEELEVTTRSILTQTLEDIELIIIDDGNTITGKNQLQAIAGTDARIRLIENVENIGLTRSLIKGCEAAGAPFIARIDNGDLMVPKDRLKKQLVMLQTNPEIVMIGGEIEIVDFVHRDRYRSRETQNETEILVRGPFEKYSFPHVSVMFKKDVYTRSGGYDERLRVGQDTDLWLRMLALGKAVLLPEVLAIAPVWPNSISVARNNEQILGKIRRLWNDVYKGQRSIERIRVCGKIGLEYCKLVIPRNYRYRLKYRKNYEFIGKLRRRDVESLHRLYEYYERIGMV